MTVTPPEDDGSMQAILQDTSELLQDALDRLKRQPAVISAFDRFFINLCVLNTGRYRCVHCGGEIVAVGYLDFQLAELGPDCVRHACCFDCGWTLYESGRSEHP